MLKYKNQPDLMVLEKTSGSRKANENKIKPTIQLHERTAKEIPQCLIKNSLRSLDENNRLIQKISNTNN